MIPIAKPLLGEEEKRAVLSVIDSGQLAQGKKVAEFETAFAKFIGAKHAIATSNGTTALHAALLAHNIGVGDEVITSPFSFIATANAITMTGAAPVFIDIDEHTFNLNPHLIEAAITPKTKGIMPVHLYGQAADMEKIQTIAKKHNLAVIEDACQAHGAEFQGKKVGSFGTGCFSFYPTKNMTTGEGGIITANDEQIAAKARKLITHGSTIRYYHEHLGYNYRMTDIAAAIGIEQLKKLPAYNQKRNQNAQDLTLFLQSIKGLVLPQPNPDHVFHQYTIRVTPEFGKTRQQLAEFLTKNNIGNAIFYPLPIHKQKAYSGYNNQTYPVTEKISAQVLSLPIHPQVTKEELQKIAKIIALCQTTLLN